MDDQNSIAYTKKNGKIADISSFISTPPKWINMERLFAIVKYLRSRVNWTDRRNVFAHTHTQYMSANNSKAKQKNSIWCDMRTESMEAIDKTTKNSLLSAKIMLNIFVHMVTMIITIALCCTFYICMHPLFLSFSLSLSLSAFFVHIQLNGTRGMA